MRSVHGRSGHFMVLHSKVNRAFFFVLVCFTFICYPGKEISGITLAICRNVDELAINSNAVILGFFCNANAFNVEWGRKDVKS